MAISFKNVSSTGGDGIIPLNFQDDVPKYDPSSFYNWEQDNIPIWVLEQRGDTLYRQMGFPGGNPEGVTFTLSSTGNYDESKGVYDNIYDIVERIPKRLKFPVLVEICDYGNIGKLDLANITCEGEGKLEIKNKAFFEDVNASAFGVTDVSASPADAILGNRQYVNRLYSVAASSTAINVSSTRLARKFGNYESWYANGRIFAMQGPDTDRQANNITGYIPSDSGTLSWLGGTGTAGDIQIPHPYDWFNDYGAGAQPQVAPATPATGASGWGDATPFWGSSVNSYMVQKRAEVYTQGQSTMMAYGSWFSSISLKDCQGTIILRDVLVDGGSTENDYDGATGQVHREGNGFDIENSEVILDNTASIRNSTAGYNVTNSRIKITGHCFAWRNYTKTGKTAATRLQDGTGFLSYNSDLEWDPTAYQDSRKYINYFGKSKRGLDLRNCTMRGGIRWGTEASALPNGGSQMQGNEEAAETYGVNYVECSGAGGDTLTTLINISDCNEHGFYSEGSDIEFNGRVNSFLNQGDGMRFNRCTVSLPQFTSNNNSNWGINLQGSQMLYGRGSENWVNRPDDYGKTGIIGTTATDRIRSDGIMITSEDFGLNAAAFSYTDNSKLIPIRNRAQFHVDSNNQNILVDKSSSLTPAKMNAIPEYLGQWGGSFWAYTNADTNASINDAARYIPMTHFGATPYRRNNQPGIVVTNNSDGEFVNMTYAVSSGDSGKGKVAIASNGSNMVFRGTSSTCTTFNYYPITTQAEQFRSWLSAGVVGIGNSNVEFTGPTKSSRFGVPFLAENGSHLKFNPPTFVGTDNILDISGYTLIENGTTNGQNNHTSLEVHASRACMVANKNSSIRLYGLGGRVVGDGGAIANSVDVLATGYADTFLGNQNFQWDRSTSGGYAKFYPHGFTSAVMGYGGGTYASRLKLDATEADFYPFDSSVKYITKTTYSQEEAMTGGMVCRAVQDSAVDLNLVNFYYNGLPADVSGAYYNLIGTGCGKGTDVLPDLGGGGGNEDPPIIIFSGDVPDGGAAPPFGAGGDPPGGGTNNANGGDGFDNALMSSKANTTFGTGAQQNANGQGALYTAAGQGGTGGGSNLIVNNAQPGSMTVIGDERAPAPYGTAVADGDQEFRYYAYMRDKAGDGFAIDYMNNPDPTCMGTQIQIWNIADTSRIHASNILANGFDPATWSLSATGATGAGVNGSNCHGPTGKWFNGVSLDYYGLGGRRTSYGGCGNLYANTGVFRLMLSTRGDLKSFYDVSTLSGTNSGEEGWRDTALSGGSPVDQINGAGYTHWTQNVRVLGAADGLRRLTGTDCDFPQGMYQLSSCLRVNGWGMPANDPSGGVATMQPRLGGFSAFNAVTGVMHAGSLGGQPSGAWLYTTAEPVTPLAPLGMDYYGFMRNWFDESAMGMWQNVKHMAEDKVNGVSIYRSNRGALGGGEGRDSDPSQSSFGPGVRSLNLFDLERLM